jgi:hypothetical protein
VIDALRDQVVDLVQDLNGNHVIQKCLNHLSDKQVRLRSHLALSDSVLFGWLLTCQTSSSTTLLETTVWQLVLIAMVAVFSSAVLIMPLVSREQG